MTFVRVPLLSLLDSLFELLMEMVQATSETGGVLSVQLSSVVSQCLVCLVVALGDTGKMLAALAAMLTTSHALSAVSVQVRTTASIWPARVHFGLVFHLSFVGVLIMGLKSFIKFYLDCYNLGCSEFYNQFRCNAKTGFFLSYASLARFCYRRCFIMSCVDWVSMSSIELCVKVVYSLLVLQIPQIVYNLQKSVQAVLLGGMVESDWLNQGVPSKSVMETWSLASEVPIMSASDGIQPSITGDGNYLYLHGSFGMLKIGSGYGNKERVCEQVDKNI